MFVTSHPEARNQIVKKQFAGGFMSPRWINNPGLANDYIVHAAKAGYCGWICFARQMQQNVFTPEVKDAVGALAKIVHRNGMKFLLDTDPSHWAEDVVLRDPDAALWVLLPVETDLFAGKFELFVPGPSSHRQLDLAEVSAAYLFDDKGMPQNVLPDMTCEWQHATIGRQGFHLCGSIKGYDTGRIKFYVAVADTSKIDHASKTFLQMQRELLHSYRDVPLDGVGWDEPGKGHNSLTTFRAGKDLFELFIQKNGYDLRNKLIFLDNYDDTPEAAKTRCDYYRTLSDMHYQAQLEHNALAREIWGENIILGTHQTYSGLPSDLAAGVFDHFRLGKLLTEAWTDGGFDLERKTALFPLILADSIRKGLNLRNAYYNDWTYRPEPGNYRLKNRLKTLFNVNTFTHVYSDHSEGLVNLRAEPMKSCVDNDVELLDNFNELLQERRGESQFAIWYGWEGYASLPKKYARATYTFFQNISLFLTDASMFADFVSSEILFAAVVKDGILNTAGGKYKALILPSARVLPKGLWEKLLLWSENGVKIVFTGIEPGYEADGTAIDFNAAAGCCSYGLRSYENALKNSRVKLAPDAWEPAFLDASPEIKVSASCTVSKDVFERLSSVKSTEREIYWLPGLDPREDLVSLLKQWFTSKITIHANNCIWRVFEQSGQDDFVLVLAPRQGVPGWGLMPSCQELPGEPRPLTKILPFGGLICCGDAIYEFKDCEWAALRIKDGEIVESIQENNSFKIAKLLRSK